VPGYRHISKHLVYLFKRDVTCLPTSTKTIIISIASPMRWTRSQLISKHSLEADSELAESTHITAGCCFVWKQVFSMSPCGDCNPSQIMLQSFAT
jgi:hypothetical protein